MTGPTLSKSKNPTLPNLFNNHQVVHNEVLPFESRNQTKHKHDSCWTKKEYLYPISSNVNYPGSQKYNIKNIVNFNFQGIIRTTKPCFVFLCPAIHWTFSQGFNLASTFILPPSWWPLQWRAYACHRIPTPREASTKPHHFEVPKNGRYLTTYW